MLILGIDPGATGAAALIDRATMAPRFVEDLDADPAVIVERLDSMLAGAGSHPVRAILERAQAMPKQGVVGLANYMTGYGVIVGWLCCRRIPYDTVRPDQWKRALGISRKKDEPKEGAYQRRKHEAMALARRLFPTCELGLKSHHNRAEALLLAEWARRERFSELHL